MENITELDFATTETSESSETQTVFSNFTIVYNSTGDNLTTVKVDRSDFNEQTSSYWIVETVLYALIGVVSPVFVFLCRIVELLIPKMNDLQTDEYLGFSR